MISFTGTVEEIIPRLFKLEHDQEYDFKISKHSKKRSLNANAYFHLLVNQLARKMNISDDEMKVIMVEDKRQSGDKYVSVGIIINKTYDENYDCYNLSYVCLSTGRCDYGYNTISGNLEQIDKQVIKHLPKFCIDEYKNKENR